MKDFSDGEADAERQVEGFLKEQGFFEEEKEATERERVLGLLNSLVNRFVVKAAERQNIPYKRENTSKIFTFGSYRLGVHSSGADIDTLCIVPKFVSRSEFFTQFYEDLGREKSVTGLSKVTNTFVPLMRFKVCSIPIDLVFARLDLPVIPANVDLLDNRLLKHMDEKCILSLNGHRVTDEILAVVPKIEVFHRALRFVKFWAQARRVYGHAYGYCGGVAYAICVAKVCQQHPGAGSFSATAKFFSVFSKWAWPQPVIIKEVQDCSYNLRVWNPKTNPAHKNDKMPVITPVYPPICATHNITQSTLGVMRKELARAAELFERVARGGLGVREALERLCEAPDVFARHKNYIAVAMAGDHAKEFARFVGFAEPRLRMLAHKLEGMENIANAYVFPKKYASENSTPEENALLQKMRCRGSVYSFCVIFIGVEFSSAKLPVSAPRKMNLHRPVSEFKAMLEQYEHEEESEILYDVFPMKQKAAAELAQALGGARAGGDREEPQGEGAQQEERPGEPPEASAAPHEAEDTESRKKPEEARDRKRKQERGADGKRARRDKGDKSK